MEVAETTTEKAALADRPVDELLTDEKIAAAKAMIGLKLRPEQYLRDASVDTITDFSNGVGDLNPLYRDVEYARWTKYGGLIAHPLFSLVHHWPGRSRWGLPGVHGFGVGQDWEFLRQVRPGDRISVWERVVGVEEKTGRFSGRMVMQYVESTFINQRDEAIAVCLAWIARHERKAAREKGKYADVKTHQYSSQELDAIENEELDEVSRIRGGKTRYWEDVEVGEELPRVLRGPLSLQDTMGFLVACGRGHTHGVLLQHAKRHPKHYFRNPEAGGGVEYTGIGHHRESVAKEVGVPGMYDYLPQRVAWLTTMVTNWMGDDAFLKRVRMEARRFNIQGDVTYFKGKVTRKYNKDRYALVDIECVGENQRGEVTSPGMATVVLPSKDISTRPVLDGVSLSLDLPILR